MSDRYRNMDPVHQSQHISSGNYQRPKSTKSTGNSSQRPSSSKRHKQGYSATGGGYGGVTKSAIAPGYLNNVNRNLKKRKIPKKFYKDPEEMYMELQEVKKENTKLKKQLLLSKTHLKKVDSVRSKKQKQVEELLKAHAIVETKGNRYQSLFQEVSLLKKMKQRVYELEKELQQKEEEFDQIKLDSRYTRVRELETELKTYFTEARRLQNIVDQLQSKNQDIEFANLSPKQQNLEISTLREKNLKFKTLVQKMREVSENLKERNDALLQENKKLRTHMDQINVGESTGSDDIAALKNQLMEERKKNESLTKSCSDWEKKFEDLQISVDAESVEKSSPKRESVEKSSPKRESVEKSSPKRENVEKSSEVTKLKTSDTVKQQSPKPTRTKSPHPIDSHDEGLSQDGPDEYQIDDENISDVPKTRKFDFEEEKDEDKRAKGTPGKKNDESYDSFEDEMDRHFGDDPTDDDGEDFENPFE